MMDARKVLEKELKAALAELADLDKKLEVKGDYGLGQGDPAIVQWELNLALRNRVEKKVEEIKKALKRLDEGTYGICEVCGKQIEEGRLEVLPYTTLCSRCAQFRR